VTGIRGAITIDANTEEDIIKNTSVLLEEVIKANKLDKARICSIFFSSTKDITAAYPAKAARLMGFTDTPLMCFQEMDVAGGLQMCIRLCIFYNEDMDKQKVRHVYLKGAAVLRPDLAL